MLGIGSLYRRLANKPSQAPRIDTAHPLSRGLIFAAVPIGSKIVDLVSGQSVEHPGTLAARVSSDGNDSASVAAIGANAAGGQFAQQTGLDTLVGAFSIFAEASLEVNATEARLVRSFEGTNGHGIGFALDDASVVNNGMLYWAENGNRGNSTNGILGTNSEQFTHRVMCTHDGVTTCTFYAKGATAGTSSTAIVPVADANRRTTFLGSNGTQQQGSASIVLAWNRALSLAEYLTLWINPWQLFVLPSGVVAIPAAAGGGNVLMGQCCT